MRHNLDSKEYVIDLYYAITSKFLHHFIRGTRSCRFFPMGKAHLMSSHIVKQLNLLGGTFWYIYTKMSSLITNVLSKVWKRSSLKSSRSLTYLVSLGRPFGSIYIATSLYQGKLGEALTYISQFANYFLTPAGTGKMKMCKTYTISKSFKNIQLS